MRGLPSRFQSIFYRLLLGTIIAVLIPTFLAYYVIQNEVRSVDRRNLVDYMQQEGKETREDVESVFTDAVRELNDFTDEFSSRDRVNSLILGISSGAVMDTLNELADTNLVANGPFSSVRIINRQGMVVFSSGEMQGDERVSHFAIGEDQSGTPVFETAETAQLLGEPYRWHVQRTEDGTLSVELISMFLRPESPFGYLIGTLNYEKTLYPILHEQGNFLALDSYLALPNREGVIADDDFYEHALRSAQFSPIGAASNQRSGAEIYRVDGADYVGYYSPLEEVPLVHVSELPASTSLTLSLETIYGQGIVVVLAMVMVGALIAVLMARTITPALRSLRGDITALTTDKFDRPVVTAYRQDEIGSVARAFTSARSQIQSLLDDLQANISSRTRDLQATQEVSRYVARQHDVQELMDSVVNLIVQLFADIYHAQIFLIDEEERFAVLRASTGDAGQKLLARGHRLEIGGVSVIGQVTQERRIVIARDTADSDIHRRNEFLLETRAELAIPLRVGDETLGALDVQSKLGGSFTQDEVEILETMADQIAIAIENARLYEEALRRLQQAEVAERKQTSVTWKEHMHTRRQRVLTSVAGVTTETDLTPLRQMAMVRQQPIVGAETERATIPFAVPIVLRGQVLGAVEWELPIAEFSEEKVQLAQELVNRLSISLDNARLFQESQRAANRERLVNEIAAKLSAQNDIEEILQTAVREVGQALHAPQVSIQFNWSKNGNQGIEE